MIDALVRLGRALIAFGDAEMRAAIFSAAQCIITQ
jgi:hypothetical protein